MQARNVLLFLFSLFMFALGYYINKDIYRISSWPVLQNNGKVISTYIDYNNEKGLYKPIVKYQYTINNEVFENDTIVYTKEKWYNNIDNAEQLIEPVKNQDKMQGAIDIIYNPLDLNETYLVHKKHNTIAYIVGIISLFLSFI